MKKFFILIITLVFLLSSCTFKEQKDDIVEPDITEEKVIGTWINYNEINKMICSADTQLQFENLVKEKVNNLKEFKINTIFLQVRAFDDCFYRSELCPVSVYCKGKNNELKFDVLEAFINVCQNEYIEVHAWINPYRIRNDNDLNKIYEGSLASEFLSNENSKEKVIITDNKICYNPAYPEVQNYILNCIREIIDNYNIDGIHMDDYFYPTTFEEIDNKIYQEYLDNGGMFSKDNYRRNCINSLVSSIYSVCKNNNLIFSVSPSADIDKNYNELYADVKLWATNAGFADYIIPQLYYGFNHETMPFEKLLNDWIKLKNSNNKIIIGLGVYKIDKVDEYAGLGKNEWIDNDDIISRQIALTEQYNADGYCFYSSSFLSEEIFGRIM